MLYFGFKYLAALKTQPHRNDDAAKPHLKYNQ